jgi:hypothetical protein
MSTLNALVFPGRLSKGEVRFTVNVTLEDLRHLTDPKSGRRFFARDRPGLPGEDAPENVRRVWAAIGEAPPAEFVSIAVRSGADRSSVDTKLRAFGNVVLEISPRVVLEDAVIFNGDVKNLGMKVAQENDPACVQRVAFDGDLGALASELQRLTTNAYSMTPTRERRVGSYFEARLRRALIPEDVLAVWVDPSDADALAAARILCA